MEKYRGGINALIGVIFAALVFLAVFYFINYNLQKTKNLRLEEKLKTAMVDKSTMADELELGEEEKQALRDQIASERKKLSASLNSRDNLTANAENLNKLILISDDQIRQLTQEKNFLQSNAIELTDKLKETLARNRALQKKLGIMKMEISALKQKLQQKEALISEKTIESDIACAEVESLQRDLVALKKKTKNERFKYQEQKSQFTRKLKQIDAMLSEKTAEADMACEKIMSQQSALIVRNEIIKKGQTAFAQEKAEHSEKLQKKERQIEKLSAQLIEMKGDIDLLVADNARQRLQLKKNAGMRSELTVKADQLSDAVAYLMPRQIAEIHFATGKWRLTAAHKAVLDRARKKMQIFGPDFIGLVAGSSDNQPFPHRSRHNNLDLSAKRALSVENWLSAGSNNSAQIVAIAISNILAPEDAIDDPGERTATFFMVKKNPSDLDGLIAGLRRCLRGN